MTELTALKVEKTASSSAESFVMPERRADASVAVATGIVVGAAAGTIGAAAGLSGSRAALIGIVSGIAAVSVTTACSPICYAENSTTPVPAPPYDDAPGKQARTVSEKTTARHHDNI